MRLRPLCLLAILALFSLTAGAQGSFVYTNNDVDGANTVSAYSVDSSGVLTPVPGSPFSTDGLGTSVRFFSATRVITAGNFLYASNASSFDVSGFSIDPETGVLTPVPGSPFPTGGYGGIGISLAATTGSGKFGHCLYAGDSMSGTVTAFGVGSEGELTRLQRIFAGWFGISSVRAAPNGRFLAAVLAGYVPHSAVAMFTIDADSCQIATVEGSPFLVRPGGPPGTGSGVDINCASSLMFVSEAANPMAVNVYTVDEAGVPTAIPGSPFIPGVGVNSNVPRLNHDDTLLFVANQAGPTVSVFSVGGSGALTLVPGSPFPVGAPMTNPSGMATDQAGAFLFVAGQANFVRVFAINPGGTLSQVGAPVTTGEPPGLLSLTAYPPRQCPAGEE